MQKSRLYTTLLAIWWGLIFAYALVQLQHNSSFLLWDVLRLTLPDDFVGVYYSVDDDVLDVGRVWLSDGAELSFVVSYNPARVTLSLDAMVSSHTVLARDVDEGYLSLRFALGSDETVVSLPFVSDPEYHIVVADAWLDNDRIAIQRVWYAMDR